MKLNRLFLWLILPLFCFNFFLAPIQPATAQEIPLPQNTGLPAPQSGNGGPIISVLVTVMNWILAAFLVLALISFVVTGVQYIFSFGGSIESAKKNFMYSIIAVLVVGGALIIVNTIDEILEGNIL